MARSSVLQSKWIVGTEPDQPVSRVARIALCQRLTVLQMYLRLAAKRADKDDEYVHQLRVSTRRAHGALKMFASLLPPQRSQRMRKQLKRLRHAAGVARDLDVLASRLTRRADTSSASRLGSVIERIYDERDDAQDNLVRERKRLKRADFESSSQGLLKRIRWRGSQPEPLFQDVAKQSLRDALDAFISAATDLSDLAHMHQMRLAGKRLRYAMELLAGVFEPAFKSQLYPVVQQIQDKLGRVNDHVTAATLFETWAQDPDSRDTELLTQLAAEEHSFAEATRRQFQEWWSPGRVDNLRLDFERIQLAQPLEKSALTTDASRGIA